MKKIMFLLFVSLNVFSQNNLNVNLEKKEIFTDSTIVYCKVLKESFVGNDLSPYCYEGTDNIIKEGEIILISGAEDCKSSYPEKKTSFYEVRYNNKKYFIKKENVFTISDYYDQILNFNNEQKEKFRERAISHSEAIKYVKTNEVFTFLKSCKTKGLAILNWSFYDESEYTDGTSAKIEVYNPTGKTIKYLWFSFIGYNAVDDVITNRITGLKTITTKGIGPIKPEASGEYNYDYIWLTDLVEKVKISQIKVQYMDGTFKTILNPKEIMLSNEYYEYLNLD